MLHSERKMEIGRSSRRVPRRITNQLKTTYIRTLTVYFYYHMPVWNKTRVGMGLAFPVIKMPKCRRFFSRRHFYIDSFKSKL